MPRSTSFHIHDILQLDSKPSQEETEVQGKEKNDFSIQISNRFQFNRIFS